MAKPKQKWQEQSGQPIVECSLDDCTKELVINGDQSRAIRHGWAVHNGEWICSTHLAAIDAPKTVKE